MLFFETIKKVKCIKSFNEYITEGQEYDVVEILHMMYFVIANDGLVRAF